MGNKNIIEREKVSETESEGGLREFLEEAFSSQRGRKDGVGGDARTRQEETER